MLHIKDGFSGERIIVLPQIAVEQQRQDPLVKSLYITDIGYYPNAMHHFRERKEPVQEYVLIYCVRGKGYYRLDGEEKSVTQNQYFILPAGKPHTYWSDDAEPWTIYWIHFSGEHARYYTENLIYPMDIKPSMDSHILERNTMFEVIFYTIGNGYDIENLRYASSLLHYYLASLRYIQQYRRRNDGEPRLSSTTVVDAMKHYMEENIEKHLSLEDVAAFTGYSISHLSSVFKQSTGESPLHYFNRKKIDLACSLLHKTDMHVNQISQKLGFDDPYYFSRLFKKYKGISPKAYKEARETKP